MAIGTGKLKSMITELGGNVLNPALSYVPDKIYSKNDFATQNGWAAYALRETVEPIDPLPKGSPFNLYAGTPVTNSAVTNQVISGQRYKFDQSGFINGYRIYTITGNDYSVYLVNEPNNENAVSVLLTLTATTTGWNDVALAPRIVTLGSEFDLIVLVSEPDPTPTLTTLSYNYSTPTNDGAPASGFMLHADKATSKLNVNKVDQGGDQSVFLATVRTGDTIEGGGIKWAIQAIVDNTTYYSFTVAPTQQGSPDGIQDFVFTTSVDTPITYAEDVNYWLGSTVVRGLFTSTGGIGDLVLDDNQYGADLLVQYAEISEDWHRVAYSSEFSTSTVDNSVGTESVTGDVSLTALSRVTTNARFGVDAPVYVIDEDINITGSYTVNLGFEVSGTATNRAINAGLYINNVLQDNVYSKEPKDSRDLLWVNKVFDYEFTGFTNIKIAIGKGNGGGASQVTMENTRFKAVKI